MAQDLYDLPLYDMFVKSGTNQISDIWRDSLATLMQSLQEVISKYGIFVPRITQTERDNLQNVVNGQLIYNTTANKFQGFENNAWANLI